MLCDRHTTNFAGSQIGFINFMILPYFSLMSKVMPGWKFAVDQCGSNAATYKTQIEKYEELKK